MGFIRRRLVQTAPRHRQPIEKQFRKAKSKPGKAENVKRSGKKPGTKPNDFCQNFHADKNNSFHLFAKQKFGE